MTLHWIRISVLVPGVHSQIAKKGWEKIISSTINNCTILVDLVQQHMFRHCAVTKSEDAPSRTSPIRLGNKSSMILVHMYLPCTEE